MIVVRVTPATDMRRAFAEWAVAQVPKLRTISSRSFAVPPDQFTHLPEYLLIGAMVDGHMYVPAGPEEEEPHPPPSAAVTVPEQRCPSECTGHPPTLPVEAYPPSAALLDLVGVDAPTTEDTPAADDVDDVPATETDAGDLPGIACPDPLCGRTFATERGLAAHRRQTHAETED